MKRLVVYLLSEYIIFFFISSFSCFFYIFVLLPAGVNQSEQGAWRGVEWGWLGAKQRTSLDEVYIYYLLYVKSVYERRIDNWKSITSVNIYSYFLFRFFFSWKEIRYPTYTRMVRLAMKAASCTCCVNTLKWETWNEGNFNEYSKAMTCEPESCLHLLHKANLFIIERVVQSMKLRPTVSAIPDPSNRN